MNRWMMAAGGVLLLASVAWIGIRYTRQHQVQTASSEKTTLELLNNPTTVPAVTMKTLEGRTISSADWTGKVIIVNFWATWCAPCRAEIPDLIALQEKYRDQLQIIGISEDEDPPEAVKKFADGFHVNYPIVMLTPEIEKAFPGIYALPTSFIVDRTGRIVQKHVGMLDAETTERETRALAGIDTNVTIEYVDDSNTKLIKNAAQATEIPGLDLARLPAAARSAALQKLNADNCTCGCALTLAACRINDPTCGISLPIAQKIVDEAARR